VPQDHPQTDIDHDLVPPAELLFDGTSNAQEFTSHGQSFVNYFLIDKGGLRQSDRVLDIGSGNGQKARALTGYLDGQGSYEGLEIVAKGVDWCNEHYGAYSNFQFSHADIYSSFYNPAGSTKAAEYQFPYPDHDFDFLFLSSIFTHMLPREMRNYFNEIGRVLRPGGTAVITFFLLNQHSRDYLAQKSDRPGGFGSDGELNMPHEFDDGLYRVWDPEFPEQAVAHDEERVRTLFRETGLDIVDVTYGNWCRRDHTALQDVVVARKS